MSKDIEAEISGPLSKEKNTELAEFFDKNGKKTNVKHRVLIDYSTFLGDGLRNRKKDIRLRITNGNPEIIVKLGDWNSSNHRKELGLEIFTDQGYMEYIETLNKEANEVFDFKNYTENYFEDRYHFSQEKAAN